MKRIETLTLYTIELLFENHDPWESECFTKHPNIGDVITTFEQFRSEYSPEIRGSAYENYRITRINVLRHRYRLDSSETVGTREYDGEE